MLPRVICNREEFYWALADVIKDDLLDVLVLKTVGEKDPQVKYYFAFEDSITI